MYTSKYKNLCTIDFGYTLDKISQVTFLSYFHVTIVKKNGMFLTTTSYIFRDGYHGMTHELKRRDERYCKKKIKIIILYYILKSQVDMADVIVALFIFYLMISFM